MPNPIVVNPFTTGDEVTRLSDPALPQGGSRVPDPQLAMELFGAPPNQPIQTTQPEETPPQTNEIPHPSEALNLLAGGGESPIPDPSLALSMFGGTPGETQPDPNAAPSRGGPFAGLENPSGTLLGNGHAETVLGHFGAGLNSSARGLASDGISLAGLGIGKIEDQFGVTQNRLSDAFFQWAHSVENGGPTVDAGSVGDLKWNDPVGWLKYAAYMSGEGVPFLLSMAAGGAGTAGIISYLDRKGVGIATRAKLAQYAPTMLNDARAVGGLATFSALETGATAKDIYDMTGETKALPSIMAGTVKGMIDVPTALYLGRALGLNGEMAHSLGREVAQAMGVGAGGMTGREAVNLGVRGAYGGDTDNAGMKLLDAAVGGAVTGGIYSGVGHFGVKSKPPVETPAQDADYQYAVAEMPSVLGAEPGTKINTPLEHAIDSIRFGLAGGATVAAHYDLNETLSQATPEAGDLLYAVNSPSLDRNIGIRGSTGDVALVHEGQPFNPTDFAKVQNNNLANKVSPENAALKVGGQNLTFGGQDYALQESQRQGRKDFIALDKSKVTRAMVTAGTEDLPISLNDPRITFSGDEEAQTRAKKSLLTAIKMRLQSLNDPERSETIFHYADLAYRDAINHGARVEPAQYGTIKLRDESQAPLLAKQADVSPTISSAKFAGAKYSEGEGSTPYPYFNQEGLNPEKFPSAPANAKSSEKNAMRAKSEKLSQLQNKAIDLSQVLPQDVTAVPDNTHVLSVIRNPKIFRDYDLTTAKRAGITAPDQGVLKDFVNYLIGHTEGSTNPLRQKGYMDLVKRGLRLQVTPNTPEFLVLRNMGEREFIDVATRETTYSPSEGKAVTRPRFGRTSVLRTLSYEDKGLKDVFLSSLRGTDIQKALSGYIRGAGQRNSSTPKIDPEADTLGGPLENILKPFGITAKIQMRIRSPKLQKEGIIVTKERIKKDKSTRIILNINPWAYAQDTVGAPGRGAKVRSNNKVFDASMEKYGVDNKAKFTAPEHLAAFWSDLGNALGQAMYVHEFSKIPQGEKDLLREAFNRQRNDNMTLSLEAKVARTMAHPIVQREIDRIHESSGNVDLDFEKWLAQGIGRRFTTDKDLMEQTGSAFVNKKAKALTTIDKVIQHVLQMAKENNPELKALLEADPDRGAPHSAIRDFIDSLQARFNETFTPLLEDETRESAVLSRIEAQKDLADLGLPKVLAEPERATSVQLKELEKLLDPKLDAKAINRIRGLRGLNDRFSRVMKYLLGIQEVAKANPGIKGLQDYMQYIFLHRTRLGEWTGMADERVRQWMNLGKGMADKLSDFMWDYDKMTYLDQAGLRSGKIKPRRPTVEEFRTMAQRHGLSKEAIDVFRSINKDFLQFLAQMEQVTVEKIQRTVRDPEQQEQMMREVAEQMTALRQRPYFPHMRFGEYTTTVTNRKTGKTVHYEAFPDPQSREAANREMLKAYPTDIYAHENDVVSEVAQHYLGLPEFALRVAMDELGLNEPELTDKQKADKKTLQRAAVMAAPITSFRKQMVRRKGTPGYSLDGQRSYANYFLRGSAFLGRQEFGDRMQAAINDIRESGAQVENDTRTKIADYVQTHFDDMSKGGTELGTIRGLTYMWYLGFVPVSAAVNMTQLPLVSLPHLADKFGDIATGKSLAKEFVANMKERLLFWKSGKAPPDSFLTEAWEQGNLDRVLNDGLIAELAGVANGGVMQRILPGNDLSRKMRSLSYYGSYMFQQMESMNRQVTFTTALKLALRSPDNEYVNSLAPLNEKLISDLKTTRGWTDLQARAYIAAKDSVNTTQFQYSKTFRPKITRSEMGSLVFLLKNYTLNMANFAFRSNYGTMLRFWGVMAMTAGLMGLPGMEDASKLIKLMFAQIGYRMDVEEEVRNLMKGISSGPMADYLLHGASRSSFGPIPFAQQLGLPSFDLSRNLSLGKLIPGLSAGIDAHNAQSKDEFLGKVAEDILGPAFGIPWNMYQAMTDHSLMASDPKRWERALPRAAKETIRGSRYLAEGKERSRGDATIAPFDPTDPVDYAEGIGMGLGFSPTKVNQAYDLQTMQKDIERYWQTRRVGLVQTFTQAVKYGDKEGKHDAISAIKSYNKEVPFKEMGITGEALRRSVTKAALEVKLGSQGLSPGRSQRRLSGSVLDSFPEIIDRRNVETE